MYLLLLTVIYLAFVSLGLPDSLLGSAWPAIHARINVPISYIGIISMIASLGTVIAGLMSERLTKRFDTKSVTIVSVFMTSAAMYGFSVSGSMRELCLWAIPYGFGGGAIDAALNNYVALHYNSRHMSWLHCFWGVGTIISPYIMSYSIINHNWTDGYRIVAILQLIIGFILVITIPFWKINKAKETESNKSEILGIKKVLKIKGVPSLLTGFFAYCSAEATAMLWASSFMEEVRGASKEEAAALGALFFIGITVGRFLSGFVVDRLGDSKMMKIGTVIIFSGIIAVSIPLKAMAIVGFIIIGLGCAPIYPCIIHSTPHNFGVKNSQSVIGIQMASAYIGMTFAPPVMGIIARHLSLKLMPIYLVVFFLLMIIMILKTERLCKRGGHTND